MSILRSPLRVCETRFFVVVCSVLGYGIFRVYNEDLVPFSVSSHLASFDHPVSTSVSCPGFVLSVPFVSFYCLFSFACFVCVFLRRCFPSIAVTFGHLARCCWFRLFACVGLLAWDILDRVRFWVTAEGAGERPSRCLRSGSTRPRLGRTREGTSRP